MKAWKRQDITAFRKKLKLSRKAFGNLLGVSRIHVHYIERGEREISKTLKILLDCIEERERRVKKRNGKRN
jgi:DNA-binding transcriptional regulator YiaG